MRWQTTRERTLTGIFISLVVIGLTCASLHTPIHAQTGPFPRNVRDDTGTPVTLAARPQHIGVVGDDPLLARLVEPSALSATGA